MAHSFFSHKSAERILAVGLVLVAILIIFNQIQLVQISASFDTMVGKSSRGSIFLGLGGGREASLDGVSVEEVTSTAMAVATVFPELKGLSSQDEIMSFMLPSGTPEYSEQLGGITFDDPVLSMTYLAKWYNTVSADVKQNDPEGWKRYLSLAAAPKGVSCEFCCGIGPQGASADGSSRCGCQHNPALLALTLGLIKNTDYSDAEVLREVMRWKAVFFPKDMIATAMQVAGTDPSELKDLPGMVGGC